MTEFWEIRGAKSRPPEDEGSLLGLPVVAAVIGGRMCGSVRGALVGCGRMSHAAMAALRGAVANSDPRAVGVVAATDSAVTAVPSVKAIGATPAEPAAVGVAAPIEARSLPTAIVPAEIVPAEDELDTFQRRRVAGSINAKDQQ
jgi:hypothetical protein